MSSAPPSPPPVAPLAGVRVLDLSRLLPGPYCTLVLADLGASVDKLEDPHAGDYLRHVPSGWPARAKGLSGKYVALNRDKRSLVLDLKQEAGRLALLRLVRHYDVLVESFRPGVMARLGLGGAALLASNPRLVVCAISGYPSHSAYRDRAAHDLNTVGLSAVLRAGGAEPPLPPPYPLADLGAGMNAATAICAALYAAQRTGHGRVVDVSMSESAFGFALPALADVAAGADAPDFLAGGAACYRVYRTADDRFVTVAALEPKFWAVFCTAIGRRGEASELTAPPETQRRLATEVQSLLAQKTRAEWEAVFAAIDGCCEPLLDVTEAAQHPLHRDSFVERDGVRWPATALARSGGSARRTGAPTQGQHSVEILTEAGFSSDEIAALAPAR